jgi:hypothetical protein
LIVLPLEAVCDPWAGAEENWANWDVHIDNDAKAETAWYGWATGFFPNTPLPANACLANVVGGAPFVGIEIPQAGISAVHALAIQAPLPQYNNWWTTFEHVPVGSLYDTDIIKDSVGSFYYYVKSNLPQACSPATCAGCCTTDGLCETGDTTWACGYSGGTCSACGANQQCTAGACVTPPPPPCGPSNCAGCCNAQGVCVGGNSASACGAGGGACVACPSVPNGYGACSAGVCTFGCNYPYHACGNHCIGQRQICND